MIKAVLFDFGGVLSAGGQDVKNTLAAMLGVDPDAVILDQLHEDYRRGLISTDEFFKDFGKKHHTHVTAEQFMASSDIFNRSQPVYDLAMRLRQKNIHTGILSNIYPETAKVLKLKGFYNEFEPLLLSCKEHFAKPDKEFYEIALAKLNLKPENILFIDDQDKCLPPALELGMHVIKALRPEQIVKDTTKLIMQENNFKL